MIINDDVLKNVAEKSLQNAKSLIADADLLRENKRSERAYTLYQLAMEEVGKAIISMVLLVVPDGLSTENKKMYQKEFFEHALKSKRSRSMVVVIAEVLHQGNVQAALSFLETSFAEDEKELNNRKNYSLYTTIINNEVKRPDEMINEEMLNDLYIKALSRFNAATAFIVTGLTNLPALKEYARAQIKSGKVPTPEQYAKDFWDGISVSKEKID